jgi:hypothetical protein
MSDLGRQLIAAAASGALLGFALVLLAAIALGRW